VSIGNTLAQYDKVFFKQARLGKLIRPGWSGSKKKFRQELYARPTGKTVWQRLQGKCYGRNIGHACLFSGVTSFLLRCQHRGMGVFIVSHKTAFGHFDETRASLRKAVMS